MENRKTIEKLKIDQVIEQQDDLTITGSVDENAQIKITDGSLIIHGNVEDGVHITVKLSEELRNSLVDTSVNINNFGNIIIGNNGYINGKNIQANCISTSNNKSTYSGNVRINNRIFTNDQVVTYGGDSYEITASNNNFFGGGTVIINGQVQRPNTSGMATATIDGKQYKGRKINVNGTEVIVDGVNMTNVTTKENITPIRTEKPKFIIYGNVGNNVIIDSDVEIEIKGKVGNFCQLKSSYSGLNAKDIGEETSVDVRNTISVLDVGKKSNLTSKQYGLDAQNLKNDVTVDVRDTINISGDISNGCVLKSHQYGLNARNLGDNVTVCVRDTIKVKNIGSNSTLTSNQYGLTANDVKDNVTINVRDAIDLDSVGNGCVINSNQYGLSVTGNIGNNVKIKVREDISAGSVGNHSQLTSNQGKIKISGNSGDNITFKARESIKAKDIGQNSVIESSQDEVSVNNLGSNVTITARDDIDIDGYCPKDATLKSRSGKVRKANVQHPPVRSHGIYENRVQNNFDHQFERDMQAAIKLSQQTANNNIAAYNPPVVNNSPVVNSPVVNNSPVINSPVINNAAILNRQGIFPSPIVQNQPKNEVEEIPKALTCPISLEIMKDPVMFDLDDTTYDRESITTWLKDAWLKDKNPTSPITREKLIVKEGKTIDEAINKKLRPNRAIKDMIDEFQKANSAPQNTLGK